MDLHVFAQSLLTETQNQLTSLGCSIPERVYCAPGMDVAFDCEQLTIHLSRIITNFQSQDSPRPIMHAIMRRSAEYFITLVRCCPTINDDGSAPDVQDMENTSAITMNDAMYLRQSLEAIDAQHLVVPRNIPTTVGQLNTIGPMGGFVANQIMYSVELVMNPTGWVG